jgi:predicted RNA-binding protein with PIN domain
LIVDGMNVIGSRPDGWWNDPDRAVRRFIEELDRFAASNGEQVTVVFDRHPRDLSAGRHGSVDVAFASRRGRNAADHDIAALVAGDPSPRTITVVTSDVELARRLQELGADVRSAGWFRRRLDEMKGT